MADQDALSPVATAKDNTAAAGEKGDVPYTVASIDNGETLDRAEPEKTYYSKASVWFMVLFSGLAIGSDG